MKIWKTSLFVSAALSLSLVLASLPADAGGGARTRPGGGSSAGTAAGGGSKTRAGGQASYRHGGRGGHVGYHVGYYGHYGRHYYPPYWGWPYVYWGPYYYGYRPPVYVYSGDDRALPAVVETDVRPKKAAVKVDGDAVGQARDYNGSWDLLFLAPGRRLLEFEADGYRTLRLMMELEAGGYYRLNQRLAKGEGIDPRSIEELPEAAPEPAEPVRRPATRPAPERPALDTGLLHLRVSPRDAAVYLDGDFLARADELARLHGAIPVVAGTHVIEVVRPGYVSQRREIRVDGDEPQRVEIDLRRKD